MLKMVGSDISLAVNPVHHEITLVRRITERTGQSKTDVELRSRRQRLLYGCKATLPPCCLEHKARYRQLVAGITVVQNSFELIEFFDKLHSSSWESNCCQRSYLRSYRHIDALQDVIPNAVMSDVAKEGARHGSVRQGSARGEPVDWPAVHMLDGRLIDERIFRVMRERTWMLLSGGGHVNRSARRDAVLL